MTDAASVSKWPRRIAAPHALIWSQPVAAGPSRGRSHAKGAAGGAFRFAHTDLVGLRKVAASLVVASTSSTITGRRVGPYPARPADRSPSVVLGVPWGAPGALGLAPEKDGADWRK